MDVEKYLLRIGCSEACTMGCFHGYWLSWGLRSTSSPLRSKAGLPVSTGDHFIIFVTLKGHWWLCDVGFGAGFEAPISLETNGPQKQDHGVLRIRCEGETLFLVTVEDQQILPTNDGNNKELKLENRLSSWRELYKFTLQPRQRQDFKAMCNYHQSSPSSLFYCKSLCTLLLPSGRVTYIGRKLTATRFPTEEGGPTTKSTLELTDKGIPDVLRELWLSANF